MQRVVHRSDGDVAARDTQVGLRLDAVIAGLDDERAAVDGHESLRGFRVLVRFDAIAARDQREVAVRDLDAVAAAQRVLYGIHHVGSTRDHKVVLRAHRMAVRAGHRQGSRSVQREVGTAEQRGVRLVGAVFEHVFRAVGERVLRPVGQRDEALVGLLHVHGGPVLVVNGRARKDDLHLRVLRRLHRQLPVVERARHHVDALGRDGHRGAVNRRAIALHAGRPPAQHDMHGGSIVVRSIRIALAVVEIERRRVESRRNLGKRSSLARVGSRPERVRLTPINGHPSSRPPAPQIRRTPRQSAGQHHCEQSGYQGIDNSFFQQRQSNEEGWGDAHQASSAAKRGLFERLGISPALASRLSVCPFHYNTSLLAAARPQVIFKLPLRQRSSSIMRFSVPGCFIRTAYSSRNKLPMLVVCTIVSSCSSV